MQTPSRHPLESSEREQTGSPLQRQGEGQGTRPEAPRVLHRTDMKSNRVRTILSPRCPPHLSMPEAGLQGQTQDPEPRPPSGACPARTPPLAPRPPTCEETHPDTGPLPHARWRPRFTCCRHVWGQQAQARARLGCPRLLEGGVPHPPQADRAAESPRDHTHPCP